jgi:hypothetical protein
VDDCFVVVGQIDVLQFDVLRSASPTEVTATFEAASTDTSPAVFADTSPAVFADTSPAVFADTSLLLCLLIRLSCCVNSLSPAELLYCCGEWLIRWYVCG